MPRTVAARVPTEQDVENALGETSLRKVPHSLSPEACHLQPVDIVMAYCPCSRYDRILDRKTGALPLSRTWLASLCVWVENTLAHIDPTHGTRLWLQSNGDYKLPVLWSHVTFLFQSELLNVLLIRACKASAQNIERPSLSRVGLLGHNSPSTTFKSTGRTLRILNY